MYLEGSDNKDPSLINQSWFSTAAKEQRSKE
jgi:hypothetical protein